MIPKNEIEEKANETVSPDEEEMEGLAEEEKPEEVPEEEMPSPETPVKSHLEEWAVSPNLVSRLDEKTLNEISYKVFKEFNIDKESRQEWWNIIEKSLEITKQIEEAKSYPWERAANIKYPLITTAVMQYNARTYPEVIKGDKVVNVDVIGEDPQGLKADAAKRLSRHMSYQVLEEIPEWERRTDKMLMLYPMMGVVFRKMYYDFTNRRPVVETCLPQNLIVNHEIESLHEAQRISHIIYLSENDIFERIASGLFIDFDYKSFEGDDLDVGYDITAEDEVATGEIESNRGIHAFIEQHRFLDLDNDGYEEPYIVTYHLASKKIVRIVARFQPESIKREGNKLIAIIPDMYFIDYHFIPSPDGKFHSVGFGWLLYHMNHTVNSIMNNLIDAGTLANAGGGFIASTLGIKKGPKRFRIGEFQMIDAALGTDLRASIFPLPVREPSSVLFQLLGLLIQATKEISSITNIMQGQEKAQNAPATTVLALIEQGQKIFTAIQKRLYLKRI
jgi:chaperonin GroES